MRVSRSNGWPVVGRATQCTRCRGRPVAAPRTAPPRRCEHVPRGRSGRPRPRRRRPAAPGPWHRRSAPRGGPGRRAGRRTSEGGLPRTRRDRPSSSDDVHGQQSRTGQAGVGRPLDDRAAGRRCAVQVGKHCRWPFLDRTVPCLAVRVRPVSLGAGPAVEPLAPAAPVRRRASHSRATTAGHRLRACTAPPRPRPSRSPSPPGDDADRRPPGEERTCTRSQSWFTRNSPRPPSCRARRAAGR